MLRIGLTGGIGAGKSAVAGRLAGHGAVTIDADQLAREVVTPGTEGLREVVAAFGASVLAADGTLDRAALAAAVFDDEPARRRLEGIIHPRVRARTADLIRAAAPESIVVNDVPLLVEVGLAASYHLVVVVEATEPVRLRRLVRDRGFSAAQARARIAAQTSDPARRAAADVLLTNDGTVADLDAAVDALWRDRLVPFEANLRAGRPAPRAPRVAIVAPDPAWPEQADRVRARVGRIAEGVAVRTDHVGSTAVPGLAAMDVLDLQVVVPDLAAGQRLADRLPDAGLVRFPGQGQDRTRSGEPLAKLVAGNADPARAVNLHLRPVDSPAWREVLLLRDWLRATPAAAAEYATLKRRLASAPHDSIEAYADRKTPWLATALIRAGAWAASTGWHP